MVVVAPGPSVGRDGEEDLTVVRVVCHATRVPADSLHRTGELAALQRAWRAPGASVIVVCGHVDLRLHLRPFSHLDAAAFHPRLSPGSGSCTPTAPTSPGGSGHASWTT